MPTGRYPSSRFMPLNSWILSSRTMCLKFQLTRTSTSATVATAIWSMSFRKRGPNTPRLSYTESRSRASVVTERDSPATRNSKNRSRISFGCQRHLGRSHVRDNQPKPSSPKVIHECIGPCGKLHIKAPAENGRVNADSKLLHFALSLSSSCERSQ